MSDSGDYRQIAYRRYDPGASPDFQRFARAYERRLSGKLFPHPDWRCADLACGYGNFLAFLRKCGVNDYVGVDSAAAAVTVGKAEFGDRHAIEADVFAFLEATTLPYNLISALDFIEHLKKEEIFVFLALVRNSLVSGGNFLLRLPNANSPFGMAARYNDITHETCFTTGAIADVLATAGFRVLWVWEDIPRPGTPIQIAHWLAWQFVRAGIRAADAAETGVIGDGVFTRNMWVLACTQN